MSKLVIEIDTVDKTYDVSIDGASIPDVYAAEMYCYPAYEEGKSATCNITISTGKSNDNGTYTMTKIYASKSKEGKKAIRRGKALEVVGHPELVAVRSKVNQLVR